MTITVILCTFNRCRSLEKALKSLAVMQVDGSISWYVLVVDNNSTDATRSVVDKFSREYPGRFLYQFEAQQGKSFALNAGVRAAASEVIAFVDDDVEVDRNWLENLVRPLEAAEYSGAGGRILPEVAFAPPQWMDTTGRYALAPLAIFDLGIEPHDLQEAPFGTNMAFRKAMFDKYGGFRTDLGPRPGSEIRNEDAEFGTRLLNAGQRLWYQPSAVVYHAIPQGRLSKRYFLTWWFDKARADIRQSEPPTDGRVCFLGIPLFLVRRLGVWIIRWIVAGDSRKRFSCRLKVWSISGAITECVKQYRES